MGKAVSEQVEKIAKEIEEAGASTWTITKIIKELEEETGDLAELRKKTLAILKKTDPTTANVFASFQRMNVRTSQQKIEAFDRGNIIKSLLKETNVNRGIAETIGREVENKIKDLSISHLNTALIREMVNAKLLEYGHEQVRHQYARIGMPVFEIEKQIQYSMPETKQLMIEYSLLKTIPKELGDLHLNNDIFIAAIEDFATKPFAASIQMQAQSSLTETLIETAKQLNHTGKYFSQPLNLHATNLALSRFKGKKPEKTALLAIKTLNSLSMQSNAKASLCLHAFTPEEIEEKETDWKTATEIMKAILREQDRLQAFQACIAMDSKYKMELFPEQQEKMKILNCNSQQLIALNSNPAKKPFLQMFGINLEKLAIEAKGNEKLFQEKLGETVQAIAKLNETKKQEMQKREYLKKAGISTEGMITSIGLYGLLAASETIYSADTKKEIIETSEKTVKKIVSGLVAGNWQITELADEEGKKRFMEHNALLKNKTEQEKQADSSVLAQSRFLQKNYLFRATAENKEHLLELIEKNIAWLELP